MLIASFGLRTQSRLTIVRNSIVGVNIVSRCLKCVALYPYYSNIIGGISVHL